MRILGLSLTRSLFIGLITFATIAVNASIPEIKPGTPFTPLEPTREESITTQQVMSNLLRGHYERKRLNDDLSSQVLDTLLDDIALTAICFSQTSKILSSFVKHWMKP